MELKCFKLWEIMELIGSIFWNQSKLIIIVIYLLKYRQHQIELLPNKMLIFNNQLN